MGRDKKTIEASFPMYIFNWADLTMVIFRCHAVIRSCHRLKPLCTGDPANPMHHLSIRPSSYLSGDHSAIDNMTGIFTLAPACPREVAVVPKPACTEFDRGGPCLRARRERPRLGSPLRDPLRKAKF